MEWMEWNGMEWNGRDDKSFLLNIRYLLFEIYLQSFSVPVHRDEKQVHRILHFYKNNLVEFSRLCQPISNRCLTTKLFYFLNNHFGVICTPLNIRIVMFRSTAILE